MAKTLERTENGIKLTVNKDGKNRKAGKKNINLWWHISATRYQIAIMIILKNYRDKTNFPGTFI